jgi:hypothetical protein
MKASFLAVSAIFIALLLGTPRTGLPQDANTTFQLKVTVHYSGAGSVDEQYKIYVVLWDSAMFVKGSGMAPAAVQSTSSKDGTLTFDDVKKSPVYVSAAYDPSGQWSAQSPPPDGSSLGVYSKTPGTPEPIGLKAGRTTSIELPFDDTVKMKGGHPTQ